VVRNAELRYYQEIDIVNVLNTVRMFKATFTALHPPYQRMLLQLQRNQVIESGSEDFHDELWNGDIQQPMNMYRKDEKETMENGLGYVYVLL
jgi:hypothetical protein